MLKTAFIQIFREVFYFIILPFDFIFPKRKDYWLFATHPNYPWGDNLRTVFDHCIEDPDISPIILCNDKKLFSYLRDLYSGCKIVIVSRYTPKGIYYYMRSRVIFIGYTNKDLYTMLLPHMRHIIVNLWHGIPIKAISLAQAKFRGKQRKVLNPHYNQCDYLISTSHVDRSAMSASMMHNHNDVWVTGLPRFDLLDPAFKLPKDLQNEEDRLSKELEGKKLLLYAPTFRDWDDVNNPLSETSHMLKLSELAQKNGYKLGLRLHPFDRALKLPGSPDIIDCGSHKYGNSQIILRGTDILITDYSSIWTDYLLLDKPVIGFCFDYDKYIDGRSMMYDLEKVFPGKITRTYEELLDEVNVRLRATDELHSKHVWTKNMFFKYEDFQSTARVVENVKNILR